MALAVRLTPESIEPFSPRAAQMLGDLNAEREAADGADADDAARMVDALGGRKLTVRQHHALVTEVTEALRRIRSE
jgi:hypothetical protein